MSDPGHDEIQSLLGAFALDAVDPDEAEAVRRHLDECGDCQAEVDAHRAVAGALGNSVEPLPPELWDRIAERIAESPGPTGPPPAPPDLSEQVVPLDPARRAAPARSRRGPTVVLGVAAAALVLVVAAYALGRSHPASPGHGGLSVAVAQAMATPGHQVVDLRSPDGTRLAQVVAVPGGHWYLARSDMPRLPGGRTYQLWGVIDGRYISLGLLGPHPSQAAFSVGSASPIAVAVSVEPAGGVASPDLPPVASGTVAT
ncbi:MAG TPA: anti-sigma factor [Acidimicrobiales bacterium]|nr:anti-sigma factor [Acidimicrobiales bacterium]